MSTRMPERLRHGRMSAVKSSSLARRDSETAIEKPATPPPRWRPSSVSSRRLEPGELVCQLCRQGIAAAGLGLDTRAREVVAGLVGASARTSEVGRDPQLVGEIEALIALHRTCDGPRAHDACLVDRRRGRERLNEQRLEKGVPRPGAPRRRGDRGPPRPRPRTRAAPPPASRGGVRRGRRAHAGSPRGARTAGAPTRKR